jgi:outer membrane protein assembly factor BamB
MDLETTDIVGDALVTTGVAEDRNSSRVVVEDARTGKTRWTATSDDRVSGGPDVYDLLGTRIIGDRAGDWTLVTRARRSAGGDLADISIIGLDGRTGALRWRIPVEREQWCTCPVRPGSTTFLGPADAATVTVAIHTGDADTDQSVKTVAYDIATRKARWTAPGLDPQTIDGGIVVATRPRLPTKSLSTWTLDGAVGLDLASGAVRWTLDPHRQPERVFDTGATLVIATTGGAVLLDPATGEELGNTTMRPTNCSHDGTLTICIDNGSVRKPDEGRVAVVGRATMTRVPGTAGCIHAVAWQGLVYCDQSEPTAGHPGAVDPAGGIAVDSLPGRILAVGDRFAVFGLGNFRSEEGDFAVYSTGS